MRRKYTKAAAPKRPRRGPDSRPRLKAGEVRCATCDEPVAIKVAVSLNGHHLHPIGCFASFVDTSIGKVMKAVEVLR